ncbi:MAG TPA: hypothetical protein VF784_14750 [Anaerolineales bacterium]
MVSATFRDWLAEQEQKKGALAFLLEWLVVFGCALLFWSALILSVRPAVRSLGMAVAVSSVYASASIYIRLLKARACRKCRIPLVLSQEILGKRYVRDEERCLEIEHGGEEWYGHFIDLYSRRYRIEIFKYRCRRCHAVWDETTIVPASDYELIRTIDVKD